MTFCTACSLLVRSASSLPSTILVLQSSSTSSKSLSPSPISPATTMADADDVRVAVDDASEEGASTVDVEEAYEAEEGRTPPTLRC